MRVTLQFYQATRNGVISNANVKAMAAQIKKVYGKGDYVGSLVVPTAPIASARRTGSASGRAPRVSPSRISPG